VLCYAIGNEIPAHIVRWYGHAPVERFLERLYRAAKKEDPGALVSYVNYPSTEYLDLPFVDLVCFNVYLERPEKLQSYLARLQNIAGDRPLVMAEIGLDSRGHGETQQAETLEWQVGTVFSGGCAGAFVFSWTDQWCRGGAEITDWDFGLTRRDRSPKPAVEAVERAFANVPFPLNTQWPRVSVVVCSYNGSRTIGETLAAITKLRYPNFEVIVVDDGSEDVTPKIAGEYDVRLIRTRNEGLSAARNTGMRAATGEIVAYIDDDAWPDPHWLHYLAATFMNTPHVGVGGPNIAPAGDGPIARCVAHAPGGPIHVLLTDHEAEHLPGCNMAFRKSALEAVGGFDPIFRIAGDDVDVCWKLQEQGWTLGFHASALVWHHRRNSVGTFLKQQLNYGKAEADLERKWPHKYNAVGHATWTGRLYSKAMIRRLGWWSSPRIYHGTWGSAPFQSASHVPQHPLLALPTMPEWWIVVASLFAASCFSILYRPMRPVIPFMLVALAVPVLHAAGERAEHPSQRGPGSAQLVQVLGADHGASRHAAAGTTRRAARSRAHAVAPPRRARIQYPLAAAVHDLERALAGAGGPAARVGGAASRARRARPPRRGFRPVGP
jgi:GT2 family glycosyltransferase